MVYNATDESCNLLKLQNIDKKESSKNGLNRKNET